MNVPTNRLLAATLALAVAALPACSDSTGSKAGPAAHVDVVSGNAQSGPAGTELPQPVVVKVTDAQGRPVQGQVVSFVVTGGGGHVFAGSGATDGQGLAQERWTLGTAAGPQTLEARTVVGGQPLSAAVFTATAVAGAPATAVALGGDTSVAGVPGSVVEDSFAVVVRDQHGNPAPGVQVAWAVTGGGGSITSPTPTDAAGIARTQWVLGPAGPATQSAQATVAGTTVRFTARAVTQLVKTAGDGSLAPPGTVVTVSVSADNAEGLPIHWTVTGGGGSVSPAISRIGGLATASAQWTLGPSGPQTLTASSGSLSVTFTATSVLVGSRTLKAQVPGRILDLDVTRVLWLDSATTRKVKLRDLADGSDALVVADGGVLGRLTPTGALVVRVAGTYELVEYRAGAATSLGPVSAGPVFAEPLLAVSGGWAAWMAGAGEPVIRRDLAAGTNLTVSGADFATSGVSVDVGLNGDVAFERRTGGAFDGVSYVSLFHAGTTTTVFAGGSAQPVMPRTDGGNVVYVTHSLGEGDIQWLWHGGATERLTAVLTRPGSPRIDSRLAGGWVAYLEIHQPLDGPGTAQVRLRTPAGADEAVSRVGAPLLDALCPDGSVAYTDGVYVEGNPVRTRRYLAYRNGPVVDVGPPGGTVVCRGLRFFLYSGSAGYELSQ
ncbi:MAG TPA: Ig-like domain-containing protein [Longimicrobium sp.]|nr:Ig-like domain-containing protein [Longimicrobium sp.]